MRTIVESVATHSTTGSLGSIDVSALSGDFTLTLTIHSLTGAKRASICVQDSLDSFASDATTQAAAENIAGPIGPPPGPPVVYTWRSYQLPSSRIGQASAKLRLFISSLDAGGTVITSLMIDQ